MPPRRRRQARELRVLGYPWPGARPFRIQDSKGDGFLSPLPPNIARLSLGGTLLVMWPCSDEEPAQCPDCTRDGAEPMQHSMYILIVSEYAYYIGMLIRQTRKAVEGKLTHIGANVATVLDYAYMHACMHVWNVCLFVRPSVGLSGCLAVCMYVCHAYACAWRCVCVYIYIIHIIIYIYI